MAATPPGSLHPQEVVPQSSLEVALTAPCLNARSHANKHATNHMYLLPHQGKPPLLAPAALDKPPLDKRTPFPPTASSNHPSFKSLLSALPRARAVLFTPLPACSRPPAADATTSSVKKQLVHRHDSMLSPVCVIKHMAL